MTFDDWMRARNPKYCPTDDTVALRELRDCWITAEHHSARAQEREQIIELMRDKCRKVGAGDTAKKAQMLDKAAIEKLCKEQFTLSIAQFVKNVESEVLRRNGLTPNAELTRLAEGQSGAAKRSES